MNQHPSPSDGTAADDAPQSTIYRWGSWPIRALTLLSCLILFVMMMLTFVDVFGRKLLASPVPGAAEIISLMMPALVFCVLPLVNRQEGHVTIDLLDGFIGRRWKRPQAVFVSLVSTIAMALISWRLIIKAFEHHEFDEATDDLVLTLWWFSAGAGALACIATLALAANTYLYLRGQETPPALRQGETHH